MSDRITIYSIDLQDRRALASWLNMAKNLYGARELVWRLAYRDIAVRYRQSILGYIWAILPPLVTVAIFAFLLQRRVFDVGATTMPYVVYALWSLTVWQFFSGCLVNCTNSLVNAGTLVTKINFPKEALVFASIGQAVLEFMIRLVPVAAVMAWYGFVPSIQALWIPLVLLSVVMMALGVGFLLSILNLVLRDAGNALTMILTFATFLAPVFYPPPTAWPFTLVNVLNPFSPLLIATQDLMTGEGLSYPVMLFVMFGFSIVLFLTGWKVFCITMPKIAERA